MNQHHAGQAVLILWSQIHDEDEWEAPGWPETCSICSTGGKHDPKYPAEDERAVIVEVTQRESGKTEFSAWGEKTGVHILGEDLICPREDYRPTPKTKTEPPQEQAAEEDLLRVEEGPALLAQAWSHS